MRRALLLGLFLVVLIYSLCTPAAQATSIPAVTFNQDIWSVATPIGVNETIGWQFTVSGSILVTNLGVFDSGLGGSGLPNGLADAHTVGIWDTNSATLLVSAPMNTGTTDPLVNQFRYVSATPTLLGPGTYTIGATWVANSDDYIANAAIVPGSFFTGPGITYLRDEYIQSNSLVMPTSSLGGSFDPAMFGPNFEYNTVPEPTTMILLGSGLLGLWGFRRKFRK